MKVFDDKIKLFNYKIDQELGKPYSLFYQFKSGFSGSPLCLLRKSKIKKINLLQLNPNARFNFEKRPNGLLLRVNDNLKLYFITIHKTEIQKINVRSTENIAPHLLSLMWILLKLGLSKRYARYFKSRYEKYEVDPVTLTIKTINGELIFESNGYNYENLVCYFKKLTYSKKTMLSHRSL